VIIDDFYFYFTSQMALLQNGFGDTNAAGITDANHTGFHGSSLIAEL